jgi:hypothetical protein
MRQSEARKERRERIKVIYENSKKDNGERKSITLAWLKSLVDVIYDELKSAYKPEEGSIGGEYYGSSELRRQRGNSLEIVTSYVTPGSYYEPSREYVDCYAVKVGGSYERSIYKDALDDLKATFNYRVVSGWGRSDNIVTSDGYEVSLINRYGTNFSVYGINVLGRRHSSIDDVIDEERKHTAVKSNGVYSVMNDEWVKEPVADDIPEVDKKAFDAELTKWEDRYFEISERQSKEAIEKFIEDIYDLRKISIAYDGEYSIGNLVFKQLRDFGYLDELKNRKREIVSKELSLESVGN